VTQIRGVSAHTKLLQLVLNRSSDQAIRFDDLCSILSWLGFRERRQRGSHRVLSHPEIPEILNLQPRRDGTAKPYQVRQVRAIILHYQLGKTSIPEGPDES
jgi:predicted RNA binding protein YcfA (HicA-like mRNA interferase family)